MNHESGVNMLSLPKDANEIMVLGTLFALILYALDLRKILGVAKKFLKSRSFLFISNTTKSLITYIDNR